MRRIRLELRRIRLELIIVIKFQSVVGTLLLNFSPLILHSYKFCLPGKLFPFLHKILTSIICVLQTLINFNVFNHQELLKVSAGTGLLTKLSIKSLPWFFIQNQNQFRAIFKASSKPDSKPVQNQIQNQLKTSSKLVLNQF